MVVVLAVVVHPLNAEDDRPGESLRRDAGPVGNPLKRQPFVVLYRMDRAGNGDGILDPDEIPHGAESFVQQLLSESKMTVTRSTPLKQVAIAWHRRTPRTTRQLLQSAVIQPERSRPPHCRTPASHHDLAANFLWLYDSNANGSLEPVEWERIGGDWYEADADLNGELSLEELSSRFLTYERRASESQVTVPPSDSTGTGSTGPQRSAPSRAKPQAKVTLRRCKSYRRQTPHERLPAEIPDWYIQKDADRDGQIMMVEFAREWDDEKLAAFNRYDLNRDGLITPRECLAVETLR
jgi:hypothetical protein